MLTKDYIPDYLQTGHVEIEIVEHPEYGTAVKFADQGSSNQTVAEVSKFLTQGHATPPGGIDVHGEVSEVLQSMTNVSQIGSLRREKEFNLVPGGQVEFDYEGPFHVAAVTRKREIAAADFHVQREQTLHVLHQGDKDWKPVSKNEYSAQSGVPVAGHSVLNIEASIVEFGAYTVSYAPATKKIKVVNRSASSVRITFQPSFGTRSEVRVGKLGDGSLKFRNKEKGKTHAGTIFLPTSNFERPTFPPRSEARAEKETRDQGLGTGDQGESVQGTRQRLQEIPSRKSQVTGPEEFRSEVRTRIMGLHLTAENYREETKDIQDLPNDPSVGRFFTQLAREFKAYRHSLSKKEILWLLESKMKLLEGHPPPVQTLLQMLGNSIVTDPPTDEDFSKFKLGLSRGDFDTIYQFFYQKGQDLYVQFFFNETKLKNFESHWFVDFSSIFSYFPMFAV